MGGLYFWVCKMKPELPILGCKFQRSTLHAVAHESVFTGWLYSMAMVFTGTSGNLR
jgi:hypothetical protein